MRGRNVQGTASKRFDAEKLIASKGRHGQGQQMRNEYLQRVLKKASKN